MDTKTAAATLKNFFGYKEGETALQFLQELKALTPEDRDQLVQGIQDGSLSY